MNHQTLLFDMDDTLIHCNKYFQQIIDNFAEQMEDWFSFVGLKAEEIKQKQLEIDISGVTLHGFVETHFPESLVETYLYFSDLFGRKPQAADKDWMVRIGRSVYEVEVEPYPYMKETLQELENDGHRLYLYTGGVPAIQQRKIEAAGLERFFGERIFIRQHKNTQELDKILRSADFDRKNTWMIGNSMRTDVLPALENGIHSIYLPAVNEWQFNVVDVYAKPLGAYFTLNSLREIKRAIAGYVNADG